MSTRTVDPKHYAAAIEALISAAIDAYEALDNYADADQPSGSLPCPNAAMQAQMDLEDALSSLNAIPIQRGQASREKLIEYVKTGGHSGRRNWYVELEPEHLTNDQLRAVADEIVSNLRFGQRLNRMNRMNARLKVSS